MTIFRSLALPIFVVLIRTLVETDVSSAQQAQTNNASHLLHDQITNLLKGNPTPQQVRCVVCAGLADDVAQCRDVRDVGRCITNSSTPISATRKKRHASRRWNPFTWNNFPSFPRFQTVLPGSGQGRPVICPQQMPQSFNYALSSDATGYPIIDLATEISINPLIDCLSQQVVFEDDPPPLYNDPFIQESSYTCPFVELRLYSYYSLNARSRCWVMQTFQEIIMYKLCTTRFCQKCDIPSTSSWPWYGFSRNQTVNLCTTEYKRVSLWAYCPDLNSGERIVWDRIILPVCCRCQPVNCTVT
ncbi:uncharacterized protein LOC112560889 [Pomacea canaliculata]|uniref:uncharacterized protein LOC112560889 n=1 Tax=Pomacea canaliculata TaxID=400727 RepID=UPI000D73B0E7|nr:uncharacterized protein LOC112560889 [Pomacea canaliculata]